MGFCTEVKKSILADLRPYQSAVPGKSFWGCYRSFVGFRYTVWLRIHNHARGHAALLKPICWISARKLRSLSQRTGIQINPGTQIGEGLYLPHHGTIVVNPGSRIGKNCYLSHNVTIGKVHSGRSAGIPVVGDNVFIGAGAVVLGKIRLGDNSAIGVNSVVLDNVPDNVMVAGAPAKRVSDTTSFELLGKKRED